MHLGFRLIVLAAGIFVMQVFAEVNAKERVDERASVARLENTDQIELSGGQAAAVIKAWDALRRSNVTDREIEDFSIIVGPKQNGQVLVYFSVVFREPTPPGLDVLPISRVYCVSVAGQTVRIFPEGVGSNGERIND